LREPTSGGGADATGAADEDVDRRGCRGHG